MSVKYFCDLCGKEVKSREDLSGVSLGEVCTDCLSIYDEYRKEKNKKLYEVDKELFNKFFPDKKFYEYPDC